MPLRFLCALLFVTGFAASGRPAECPPLLRKPATLAQAEAQATELMRAMTPAERVDFVRGTGFGIRAMPRLGIPALNFGDASAGRRILSKDLLATQTTTAFPATVLLAATWDPALAQQYGRAVAEEFRAAGVHFILGPGLDIYRSAHNGRNFEYVGEDPLLAGRIVAGYVRGAQSVNVATTLKHFIVNDTETYRRATNAIVDERALHEIFLPPFQAGIDAGAWGVMTAYNALDGQWCGQSRYVGTELLRHELGFQYLIMTDWDSTWFGDKLAQSGTDLEMPTGHALQIDRAKVEGTPDIDRMVVDVLKTGIASGIYELEAKGDYRKPEWLAKYPAHEELSLETNEAGIVLLRNTGILPIASIPAQILVTGNSASRLELAGGGSGHVVGYNLHTYLEAAQTAFGPDHVVFAAQPTDEQLRSAPLVLVFSGWPFDGKGEREAEGLNHPFQLPEDALIARCTALNPHTAVILTCGGGVQMDWADQAAAIVMGFYGGQAGPQAMLNILTGKASPSGKLPFTIERRDEDSPAAGDDRDIVRGTDLADPLSLKSHTLPRVQTGFLHNADKTELYTRDLRYREGVFVGYRWYDAKGIAPRYPFGFGLSYTQFAYSGLAVAATGSGGRPAATVRCKITNTGARAGSEIVQIYVEPPAGPVARPPRELKGFATVRLAPGESQVVSISLGSDAFSYWHPEKKMWVFDPGEYTIDVAAASRDIRGSQVLKL